MKNIYISDFFILQTLSQILFLRTFIGPYYTIFLSFSTEVQYPPLPPSVFHVQLNIHCPWFSTASTGTHRSTWSQSGPCMAELPCCDGRYQIGFEGKTRERRTAPGKKWRPQLDICTEKFRQVMKDCVTTRGSRDPARQERMTWKGSSWSWPRGHK